MEEEAITFATYKAEKAKLKEARKAADAEELAQSARRQSNTIQTDTLSIMEGFTDALYPDFKVFGREMLANAVDAYRWASYTFEREAEKPGGKTVEQQMSEHSVALKMDLHILSAGAMIFEDYGCGMTEQVLRTNYWAVKSSAKNTPEAKAAGLIGRFGIGALATLNLCKSLKATTTNIADGKTIVTTMDMTQEIPEYTLEEAPAKSLGHAGTRIEAVLKSPWAGTKSNWDAKSRAEQLQTGEKWQAKRLSPEGADGVVSFLKLMFDCMKYTGAQVSVTIASEMCPPESEISCLPKSWEVTRPADSSLLCIELRGEPMDTTESPQPVYSVDAPDALHLKCMEAGMELDCELKLQARHHGVGKEHYVLVGSTPSSRHKASGKIYKGTYGSEIKVFSAGNHLTSLLCIVTLTLADYSQGTISSPQHRTTRLPWRVRSTLRASSQQLHVTRCRAGTNSC
jgi:hypothetical protein